MATGPDKLPIKMLNDRLLVRIPDKDGERRSSGGILIPATAQMAKRLVWAEVVALGQNVRAAEVGDNVLFSPEDRYEVEVQGSDFIMLRERDLHAVAASRIEASTGLYSGAIALRLRAAWSRSSAWDAGDGDRDDVGESGSGTAVVIRILRACPSTPVPSSSRR